MSRGGRGLWLGVSDLRAVLAPGNRMRCFCRAVPRSERTRVVPVYWTETRHEPPQWSLFMTYSLPRSAEVQGQGGRTDRSLTGGWQQRQGPQGTHTGLAQVFNLSLATAGSPILGCLDVFRCPSWCWGIPLGALHGVQAWPCGPISAGPSQ